MKVLISLLLMGSIVAKDLPIGESREPEVKRSFELNYVDLPIPSDQLVGEIMVGFVVNENGRVVEPEIIDTFNFNLNEAVIDKVMAIKFTPALQNGRPVRVRYKLPIVFK